MRSSRIKRALAAAAVLGLAVIGVVAAPQPASAWWRGGVWCCSVGVYIPPPVVVAPAPVYAPPPVYYAPPPHAWVPPHWENGYWVPGHWA
jgi:hypothetical protein